MSFNSDFFVISCSTKIIFIELPFFANRRSSFQLVSIAPTGKSAASQYHPVHSTSYLGGHSSLETPRSHGRSGPELHLPAGAVQLVLFVECHCFALRELNAQRFGLGRPLVRFHDVLVGGHTAGHLCYVIAIDFLVFTSTDSVGKIVLLVVALIG